VPAAVVTMKELPRLLNGKVNRASLPAPAIAADRDLILPRTDLEREIAAIWQDVLGCGPIGIDDNVFELGAHSLMATKAHRRIQEVLVSRGTGAGARPPRAVAGRIQRQVQEMVAQEFPLRAMFDRPTVRALAALLSGDDQSPDDPPSSGDGASEPPVDRTEDARRPDAIVPVPVRDSYPVSHA